METKALRILEAVLILVFIVLAVVCACLFTAHAVRLDIDVNKEYQGHYGLAQHSGSPVAIADNLETYLEKVEEGIARGDINEFGYTTLIYKTPENQISGQIKVVESFIERAMNLEENPGLENIGTNMALGTLKQNMEDRHIDIWCHKVYEGGYFYIFLEIILCIIFVILLFIKFMIDL